VTPPGTTLKVGERAVVQYLYGGKTGKIAVTVTAIEKGDQAAFLSKFGARAQGLEPYSIRYTVENVDGSDLSYSSPPSLSAVGQGGRLTGVVIIGDLGDCKSGTASSGFKTAGDKIQTCRLQAARAGSEVTGAQYRESEGGYSNNPITWTK
jgi:hypothetical protein